MNSFVSIPKATFLAKIILPVALVFGAGVVAMGLLADPETFRPQPVRSASITHVELPENLQAASRSGINHWEMIAFFATHVPEVCWGDNAVNDFQKKQCDDFWEHLEMGAGLSLLPFVAAWLFYQMAMSSLVTIYRKGRKRIDAGKPILSGMVTNPAQAPEDLFSRFYCLRPIGVQLANGKQMKVYIPLDAPEPSPGLTMAIFEPFSVMGEKRHFAIIYAPHVAVVSGVRRA